MVKELNMAISICQQMQDWRRGVSEAMPHSPAAFGEALDTVMAAAQCRADIIDLAASWMSLKAVKYVRMNKEMIWMSADMTEDFRKYMAEKINDEHK